MTNEPMKITIAINEKRITATMINSETTQDFLGLLPLTLTLEDYSNTERISYLPKKLSTRGAPSGTEATTGDITYYSPWGNLAIFYKDFGYAKGLVKLGRIVADMDIFKVQGTLDATFELLD